LSSHNEKAIMSGNMVLSTSELFNANYANMRMAQMIL